MWKTATLLAAAALLAGCASMNELHSDVSTYSQWPAARQPGSYTFERLPSQRENPDQQAIEDAARNALESAGFTPAADAAQADVKVQVGARVSQNQVLPYPEPFWGWGYGRFYGGRGAFFGPSFNMHYPVTTYAREVMVLIRDHKSGQPLFEGRAVSDGVSPSARELLPALFEAAMKDFPNGGVNPRKVTTRLQ